MIYEDPSAANKFIVNNKYNTSLLVNGDLTINSNLIVLGENTTLQTIVYTTERMEVVNDNNTAIALMIQQKDSNNAIFVASNLTANVFTIANNGDVNIAGNYKKNNRDVINDTSNYVLATSNYLINYNNLINKPDLAASQVNSDWNAVSGVAQILNKPDLTIIATNDSNVSNYVLATSNILVNRYNTQVFTATQIPSLDAAKITSGTFATAQIPSLPTSQITGLDTALGTKQATINSTANQLIIGNGNGITTTSANLTFNSSTNTLTATNIAGAGAGITGLTATQIPSLDAAKITSGTFATAQIPSLPTSQITGLDTALGTKQATINSTANQLIIGNGNGITTTSANLTFNSSTNTLTATNIAGAGAGITGLTATQIPSLDAAKITSGTFATAQIPSLPTSQITGLDTALGTKQATINSTANQLIIGNGNGITTTSANLTFNSSTNTLTATNIAGAGAGITGLTATQIPSLDAAKITSGTFATAQIPSLPTSQITGLDTALGTKQATINSTANQLIIGNGNGITTTSANLTFNSSTNTLTATNFTGNGSGLTNLPSSQWTSVSSGIYYNTSNVGIGTISPAQKLHVIGDIAATGRVISYYSDERLKTNISKIYNSLDIINNINGFYYEPNNTAISLGIKNRGREIGLSAQDVNRVIPEVISLAPVDICRDANNNLVSKSGSNYLTINYERLIPILVESIKELNIQISHLKKENDEFRAFKEKVANILNINL